MRFIAGMVAGALLTVVTVYLYDTASTSSVAAGRTATANTTIVNWDVAAADWEIVKARARENWIKLTARD